MGERKDFYFDAQFVSGALTTPVTDTTSTPVVAAGGSGWKTYVTDVMVTNGSASTGTRVDILSGSTVLWSGFAKAEGGWSKEFVTALKGGENEAINVRCGTTGASVYASVSGYRVRA